MPGLDSVGAAMFAVSLAGLSVPGLAQQTWVVDRNGGPGSQFTSIAAAVAVAAPGDVVRVRAGSYSEPALDIAKGIHLVGEGTVTLNVGALAAPGAIVHDIPSNQVFSMSNFGLTGLIPNSLVRFRNCSGLVALQAVTALPGSSGFFLEFTDCARVHGDGLFGPQHSVGAVRSSISLTASSFEGYTGGPLGFRDSSVSMSGCSAVGDTSGFLNVPAISVTGGELRISRSTVRVGSSVSTLPVSAIISSGGTVVLDPTATFVTAGGAAPVAGTAIVVQREIAGLSVTTSGMRATFDLIGPAGASFVNLVSLSAPPLSTPFGELWLDTEDHIVVSFGVLPTGRTATSLLDHPPLPPDFVVVFQTIVYDGTFGLSNPATL